jgi:ABC-2 type transport system ATP-binding protein
MAQTAAHNEQAVHVAGLSVVRGRKPVLSSIDCKIAAGSITGLLGPSGSGKTTLMRAIVGVQRTTGGAVTVMGLPAGHRQLRHRLGYVTQDPSVYPDLTVRENVRYFAALHSRPAADVDVALGAVGLSDFARRKTADLSGGQFSRVSLACALVGQPDLLVLDEPTVGLDPVLRVELWDHFAALAAAGTTVLVSSHVMEEASHCDDLLLLRNGRLLAQLTPGQLAERGGSADLERSFLHLIQRAEAAA